MINNMKFLLTKPCRCFAAFASPKRQMRSSAQHLHNHFAGTKCAEKDQRRRRSGLEESRQPTRNGFEIGDTIQRREIGEGAIEWRSARGKVICSESLHIFSSGNIGARAQRCELGFSQFNHNRGWVGQKHIESMLREKGCVFAGAATQLQNAATRRKSP